MLTLLWWTRFHYIAAPSGSASILGLDSMLKIPSFVPDEIESERNLPVICDEK